MLSSKVLKTVVLGSKWLASSGDFMKEKFLLPIHSRMRANIHGPSGFHVLFNPLINLGTNNIVVLGSKCAPSSGDFMNYKFLILSEWELFRFLGIF